jgi:glycosyltransferase involved in cell wall biosynthesis
VNELHRTPGIRPTVSAVEGSKLDFLTSSLEGVERQTVRTFRGDKGNLLGKLAALGGLFKLPKLALDFHRNLRNLPADVAICTMQSIWDAATLSELRRHAGRFIPVLHDAQFHPRDTYPGRATVSRREIAAADTLIVLSDHVGRKAHERYDFPLDRIWTIPHGSFSFGKEEAKPRTLPTDRPIRLLFIGRIAAYKGLGLLIESSHDGVSVKC